MTQHLLFSYGTLRLAEVQRALFGREVPTEPDQLRGYLLDQVVITDPQVLATSGVGVHPVLRPIEPSELDVRDLAMVPVVEGAVLSLNDDELAAADAYEVDDYVRVAVRFTSGRTGWAYVAA